MRSELVYSAGIQIGNRFLLTTVVIRAIRKLHIDSTRTEETANQVFADIAQGRYTQAEIPRRVPIAVLEPLLITPAA
jgi:hypothetical protein